MFRPLLADILACVVPLGIGAGAGALGVHLSRRSRGCFLMGAWAALLGLVILALVHLTSLHDLAAALMHEVGGAGRLGVWLTCVLLGILWGMPSRTWSTGFMIFVSGFLAVMLVISSGGRLLWRYGAESLWQHGVNADGALTQSRSMTCGPAAASMLLHRHGIDATEGEIAYLSNTSLLGVSLHGLAHALDAKGGTHRLSAIVQRLDYDTCRSYETPFIAELSDYGIKRHTVFVERLAPDHAEVIDPWWGTPQRMSRGDFERTWTGRIVRMQSQ